MIRKSILSFFAFIMLSSASYADGNESLFAHANQKYSDGLYSEAIQSYNDILKTGYTSAALLYNLGNSHYKNNDLTLAILNYERALLLSPGDEDIKYNLEIANLLVADKINALPEFFISKWIRQLRMGLSPDQWGKLSLLTFILTGISILLFFFLRKRLLRKLFLVAAVVMVIFSMTTLLFAREQNQLLSNRNTAIIFSPSVTAKSSPDESGTDLFVLHEGVKVWITDQLNDWLEIQLADGNKAWIPGNTLERI